MEIKIKLLEGGTMPQYKTKGAACCDCYANLMFDEITIPAMSRCLVSLGFCMELPEEYEAVIRPRSGNSKNGLDVAIGTIDADYRGEVKACLINNTPNPWTVKNGERICQMKIQKAEIFTFIECDELSDTERGSGGFGHTGK